MLKITDTIIPIVKPTLLEWEDVIAEFKKSWESGQVTTGPYTRLFEKELEMKLGISHAVLVQSCTAGLMLVLKALELEGEIIMPAFTWTATAHAAMWNGLRPAFVDIQPGNFTLDPEKVVAAITPQTAAIMPVNVFGCPPNYMAFEAISKQFKLPIIYDSAQGLGSKYNDNSGSWRFSGNYGVAEVFSMSPTKVITAMEAGIITTHNIKLAQKLRQMRDYGKTPDGEDIAWLGLSARVPEINAIVGRHNLFHMDELVARRQEIIERYRLGLDGLSGVRFQEIPENCYSSRNYFTIFIDPEHSKNNRDEVYNYLKNQRIQGKKYFYPALHLQRVYKELGKPYKGRLPVTERAALEGLALPLFTDLNEDDIDRVIKEIRAVLY